MTGYGIKKRIFNKHMKRAKQLNDLLTEVNREPLTRKEEVEFSARQTKLEVQKLIESLTVEYDLSVIVEMSLNQ